MTAMKSGHDTEFRFCKPKYQWIWSSLIFVGCLLVVGIRYVFPKAPEWIMEVGIVAACVGLLVFMFGTIAARKEWQATHKIDTKCVG